MKLLEIAVFPETFLRRFHELCAEAEQAIDGGVVACLQADEDVRILQSRGQVAQDLSQVIRTELAGSTGPVRPLRQTDLFQHQSTLAAGRRRRRL